MTSKTLLAVGLGGVVATTIGIATAQPSIADSFVRTINYTTSPEPVLLSDASKVEIDVDKDDGEVEIEVKKDKKHGFFRNIFGMPMRVIKAPIGFLHHDDDVAVLPAATTVGVVPSAVSTRTVESAVVVDNSCDHTKVLTSPAVVSHEACSKVLESPAVIDMTIDSPAVIRSTTGVPMAVEQKVLRRPMLRKVMSQPSMIEVNRVVERPTVVQRVISQPVVVEKFVEKPAIVDCVVSQPTVVAAPTVIKKSVTSPVIILDDPNDRFLYDFSTHRTLKLNLD